MYEFSLERTADVHRRGRRDKDDTASCALIGEGSVDWQ